MRRLNIAIAGAGVGGLAAAALLAGRHDVTVYDQFPAPRAVGSGLMLQPVGLAVLDLCGAGQAARALGAPISRLEGQEAHSGRRILDVAYDRKGGPVHGLAIHRAALFGALLDAAMAQGAVLVPGRRVLSAPQDGPVRWLSDDTGARLGPFDLVVDAAGASSVLSPLKGRAQGYGAVWGTVPWPEDTPLPHDRLTQRYRAARNMAGVLPMGRITTAGPPVAAIFWSLPRAELERWPQTDIEEWKARVVALWPDMAPFLTSVSQTQDMVPASYAHGHLARPHAPCLIHIGDAAHRASPQLGQGANMALLDALAVARALEISTEVNEAAARYARMRRWHVRVYQFLSAAFTPQYQSDSRVLPIVRDHVLAPVSMTWPMPGILIRLIRGNLVPPLAGQPFP